MKQVFELKKNTVQIHRWHMLNTEYSIIAENIKMQTFPKLWQSWHHNQFLHQHGVLKMHHWHKNVPITQMSPTILKFKEMKWMLLVFMNNWRESRFFSFIIWTRFFCQLKRNGKFLKSYTVICKTEKWKE